MRNITPLGIVLACFAVRLLMDHLAFDEAYCFMGDTFRLCFDKVVMPGDCRHCIALIFFLFSFSFCSLFPLFPFLLFFLPLFQPDIHRHGH
jgi:hypothetical protein